MQVMKLKNILYYILVLDLTSCRWQIVCKAFDCGVMNETEEKVRNIQAGFRKERGCMDQAFSLKVHNRKKSRQKTAYQTSINISLL